LTTELFLSKIFNKALMKTKEIANATTTETISLDSINKTLLRSSHLAANKGKI